MIAGVLRLREDDTIAEVLLLEVLKVEDLHQEEEDTTVEALLQRKEDTIAEVPLQRKEGTTVRVPLQRKEEALLQRKEPLQRKEDTIAGVPPPRKEDATVEVLLLGDPEETVLQPSEYVMIAEVAHPEGEVFHQRGDDTIVGVLHVERGTFHLRE